MNRTAILTLAAIAGSAHADLIITELSTKSALNPEDYFELTNTGDTAIDISGWLFDDESADISDAAALNGITSIAAGESVIFFQQDTADAAADAALFRSFWGGLAGVQVGSYDGPGLGKGDAINLFDAGGNLAISLAYGMTKPNQTHAGDWAAGNFDGSDTYENDAAIWAPGTDAQFVLAQAGAFGSFQNSAGEWGSPGIVPAPGAAALLALGTLIGSRRRRA